jgi:hypothetical protein
VYLEIFPIPLFGIFVHMHEVLTLGHSVEEWMIKSVLSWNEQRPLDVSLWSGSEWTLVSGVAFPKQMNLFHALEHLPLSRDIVSGKSTYPSSPHAPLRLRKREYHQEL